MDNHLICSGVDYDSANRDFRGLNFREYALERRRQLMQGSQRGRDTRVTLLDFLSGTEETLTVLWKDGKPTEARKIEKKFTPITRASYKDHAFKDGQASVMSIVDVYRAVQKIGITEPGSLRELSVFSHSFYKGPILVNSNEDADYKEGATRARLRDPDDKDGRGSKDFYRPNMSNEQLRNFRNAFHKTGYAWIWGCNFPDNIHSMLSRVERTGKSLSHEKELISLTGLTKDEISYFDDYSAALGIDRDELKKKFRCKFLLGDFVSAIGGIVETTYPYKLANVAKVRAIAALLGTFSVPDNSKRKLLKIQDDTARHVKFYAHHFGIKTDPEHRNYGIIEPTISDLTS